jgi:hypothetical protein
MMDGSKLRPPQYLSRQQYVPNKFAHRLRRAIKFSPHLPEIGTVHAFGRPGQAAALSRPLNEKMVSLHRPRNHVRGRMLAAGNKMS